MIQSVDNIEYFNTIKAMHPEAAMAYNGDGTITVYTGDDVPNLYTPPVSYSASQAQIIAALTEFGLLTAVQNYVASAAAQNPGLHIDILWGNSPYFKSDNALIALCWETIKPTVSIDDVFQKAITIGSN